MNKLFLILVLIAVIGLGAFVFFNDRIESREFAGRVTKVEGNVVFIEGVYIVKDRSDLSNPSNSKTVSVTINQNTRLTKERLFLPTAQEVEKTGGFFKPDELKREVVVGSIDDFKTGQISVRVFGPGNIYGKESFAAREITYIEPVYP